MILFGSELEELHANCAMVRNVLPTAGIAGAKTNVRLFEHSNCDDLGQNNIDSALRVKMFLLSRFTLGFLHATDVAHISYFLNQMHIPGFEVLGARNPDQPSFSSNANKIVRQVVQFEELENKMLKFWVPVNLNGERTYQTMSMLPLYEVLAEEFQENADRNVAFAEAMSTSNWINNSVKKQCVQEGSIAIPYGHFVDGVQWKGKGPGTADTVIAYNVNLLCGGARRLVFTIRKDMLCGSECNCPCRGRCSLDVVESVLQWCGEVAVCGIHPAVGPLGNEGLDSLRRQQSGKPVAQHKGKSVKFCLVEFRADGAQYSDLGLLRANQEGFCMKCDCRRDAMFDFDRVDLWGRYDQDQYLQFFDKCQVQVTVDLSDARKNL